MSKLKNFIGYTVLGSAIVFICLCFFADFAQAAKELVGAWTFEDGKGD